MVRTFAFVATLCLSLLTAGCVTVQEEGSATPGTKPVVDWSSDPCDPSGATAIARDVPWIAPWQGEPEEVAKRFAAAIGVTLPPLDETRSSDREWYWESSESHFRYFVEGATDRTTDPDEIGYSTPERWPGTTQTGSLRTVKSLLEKFGVPRGLDIRVEPIADTTSVRVVQYHERIPLWDTRAEAVSGDGSGRSGWWSGLDLRPFHDLRTATVTVDQETAVATAMAYDRCVMDRDGKTAAAGYTRTSAEHASVVVRNASLVHQVHIHYSEPGEPGHCGFSHVVNVDARTGAVHGWEWPGCD